MIIHIHPVTQPQMIMSQRIFEDHPMGNLQRLPVLIRDEAGLNQEAVDQPEHHTKHYNSGSQHTCGVQQSLHLSSVIFHYHMFGKHDFIVLSGHVWVPPSLRGESSFFEYSWECRFLSFTSSTLFPNFRRGRMFSIRTLCLSCLHSLLPT